MTLPKKGKLKEDAAKVTGKPACMKASGNKNAKATTKPKPPAATVNEVVQTTYYGSDARDDHYHGYFRTPASYPGGFFSGD